MKLKESTIKELGLILKEEFGMKFKKKELVNLAYFFVEYFSILFKMTQERRFEHSPTTSIDKSKLKTDDNKEK